MELIRDLLSIAVLISLTENLAVLIIFAESCSINASVNCDKINPKSVEFFVFVWEDG